VAERTPSLGQFFEQHRGLLGEFAFELIIVFVGVTAAFALENFREARQEASYYRTMIGGLRASLADSATHGAEINKRITILLRDFDEARKRGETPPPPVYREGGGERPPTRAWDGIVATGATRSLDPVVFFRLARFYSRADSFGERYLRYNAFSEERVLPHLGNAAAFYDGGQLRPEYAAYVDRLRDLQREGQAMVAEAATLRDSLPR
jgi:hypothetical protein